MFERRIEENQGMLKEEVIDEGWDEERRLLGR